MNDIFKNVLSEMNHLNLTENEPPILSPLCKHLSDKNDGPKQSDILKVNIQYRLKNVNIFPE